ncbi:universal stress protein [Paenibacillus azoreducens]|uniref:Universal stress protein n=1 Tax=Paenibacillus azoreducens TaxID=116718 RepID=A0A919YB48_9BACL|nr:universal stress protein [Paenibacillus azoreducens]GIO47509.1 universal stress protein [Paenibacillus azoreducens]
MISPIAKRWLEEGHLHFPPIQYSSILVAVDGSAPSIQATRHAVQLASLTDARLTAVFVDYDGEDEIISEDRWHRYAELEEEVMYGLAGIDAARFMAGERNVPFKGVFMRGSLTRSILSLADKERADLIVTGNTGLTGIRHLLLGSFAESLVKESRIPVLVVKQDSLNINDGHQ